MRDENGNLKDVKYYKFDDLKSMTNFMWETSQDVNIEISGYVLTDENGKTYYYVFDWNNGFNDAKNSMNISAIDKKTNRSVFDGKNIAAQIHTHPSKNYS